MRGRGFFKRKLPFFPAPQKISGTLVPLITPLNEDLSIDFLALKNIFARLLNKGVRNYYLFGAFSEQFFLSDQQRVEILKKVSIEAGGRAIVAVGCFGGTIDEIVERVEVAQKYADFCVVNIPSDARASALSFADFFDALLNRTSARIMLYSNNIFFGEISADTINSLLNWERFAGIISFSSETKEARRLADLCRGFSIFEENEEVVFESLRAGFCGTACISSVLFPTYYLRLNEALDSADYNELSARSTKLIRLARVLPEKKKIQAVKHVLSLKGLSQEFCFPHLSPLTQKEAGEIEGAFGIYKRRL